MVNVYVPKVGTTTEHMIDAASGIVGEPTVEDRVLLYYEGNRFGYANVVTFADRVMIAAGRLGPPRYPTVARCTAPADDLILVGQFDGERIHTNDSEALCDWLGTHDIDDELLVSRLGVHS